MEEENYQSFLDMLGAFFITASIEGIFKNGQWPQIDNGLNVTSEFYLKPQYSKHAQCFFYVLSIVKLKKIVKLKRYV